MKRSAALTIFVTAWILFAVVGIQYSLDQQKRTALLTQNQAQLQAWSKIDDGVITPDSLDREKKMLGALALVACGFMVASLGMYSTKLTQQPASQAARKSVHRRAQKAA